MLLRSNFPPKNVFLLLLTACLVGSEQVNNTTKTKRRFCPHLCFCSHRIYGCGDASLAMLPANMPNTLLVLDLRSNNISSLGLDDLQRMFYLKQLFLDGNKIKRLKEENFRDLFGLKVLHVSNNSIHQIDRQSFRHLVSLKQLDLSLNKIKYIEGTLNYLANVKVVKLAGNSIVNITQKTFFGNMILEVLDLSDNLLSFIHRQAFVRMKMLRHLILRGNRLLQVFESHLASLDALNLLDLSRCGLLNVPKFLPAHLVDLRLENNNIRSISSIHLQSAHDIQLLYLQNNAIAYISDTALKGMSDLSELYLDHNQLQRIPRTTPQRLTLLSLNYNNFTDLSSVSRVPLHHLSHLRMAHNRIHEIDLRQLSGLSSLKSLDLSGNGKMKLRNGMFTYVTSIQRLDLSNNHLREIEVGSFTGLDKLHILKLSSVRGASGAIRTLASELLTLERLLYLDVSNSSQVARRILGSPNDLIGRVRDLNIADNEIRTLPKFFANSTKRLKKLTMGGNAWHCGDRLAWIGAWMRSGGVDVDGMRGLTCLSPRRMRGRRLYDLEEKEVRGGGGGGRQQSGGKKSKINKSELDFEAWLQLLIDKRIIDP